MEEWLIDQDEPETVAEFIGNFSASSGPRAIVCFDYFDTIVTRTIIPEHTKKIACSALSRLLNGDRTGDELYRFRQVLELEMTSTNAEETGELDFCLHDFARRFWTFLHENGLNLSSLPQDKFAADLLHIEVAVEKAVQTVCPQALQVLQTLNRKGISPVLVSDFYLPENYFKDILKTLGLDTFFSRVYVSSSHRKSKGSGTIYARIAEDFQCAPVQMLMIGDNPHADIEMARRSGIQTLHVLRPPRRESLSGNRKRLFHGEGKPAHFRDIPLKGHFSEMGCSLWLFTHRLFNELRREDARDVFFLSKEGEFLKKLFVLYQIEVFGAEHIRSHYLVASRKSTFLPSLRPLDEEDFLRLFAHYRDISIDDFLRSLNFADELIAQIESKLAIDCGERCFDLRNRPEFGKLMELQVFRNAYEENRREQRIHFKGYLDSFGVGYASEGLYLVDVGWKGSIQDNIFHILDHLIEVRGFFIGSFHATERSGKNRKKGILFDNHLQLSLFYNVYNNNRSLYEMLLGATHGSADRYVTARTRNKVSAGAHLAVFSRMETEVGEVDVLVLDLPEERALYNDVIRPLQDNMLQVFSLLTKNYLLADCDPPDSEWFARRHARMVFTPGKEEIDLFASLYHLENFGIFEYTNFQSDNRLNLWERCGNLRNVLRDPAILETGIWPPIILRRLGLGFLQRLEGKRRYFKEFGLKARGG